MTENKSTSIPENINKVERMLIELLENLQRRLGEAFFEFKQDPGEQRLSRRVFHLRFIFDQVEARGEIRLAEADNQSTDFSSAGPFSTSGKPYLEILILANRADKQGKKQLIREIEEICIELWGENRASWSPAVLQGLENIDAWTKAIITVPKSRPSEDQLIVQAIDILVSKLNASLSNFAVILQSEIAQQLLTEYSQKEEINPATRKLEVSHAQVKSFLDTLPGELLTQLDETDKAIATLFMDKKEDGEWRYASWEIAKLVGFSLGAMQNRKTKIHKTLGLELFPYRQKWRNKQNPGSRGKQTAQ